MRGDFRCLIVGLSACYGQDNGIVSGKIMSNSPITSFVVSGNTRGKANGDAGKICGTISTLVAYTIIIQLQQPLH